MFITITICVTIIIVIIIINMMMIIIITLLVRAPCGPGNSTPEIARPRVRVRRVIREVRIRVREIPL